MPDPMSITKIICKKSLIDWCILSTKKGFIWTEQWQLILIQIQITEDWHNWVVKFGL